ncbi:MAG: hypothetical protein KAH09_00415 [Desulfobacula sp.]|nr:hypothetical protein [Desulfobacula sp.]
MIVSRQFKLWIFPTCVALLYWVLWMMTPDMIMPAFKTIKKILIHMAFPLGLAVFMMFLLNLFSTPAHITQFMGKKTGVKRMLMSSAAGIISMGPIFTWYPFLKILKQKGIADLYLANFLSSRAIKPILLPVLITCFGWWFSLMFTLMSLAGAWAVSAIVAVLNKKSQ